MGTRIICDNCEKRIDYSDFEIYKVNYKQTIFSCHGKDNLSFPYSSFEKNEEFCSRKCISEFFKENEK